MVQKIHYTKFIIHREYRRHRIWFPKMRILGTYYDALCSDDLEKSNSVLEGIQRKLKKISW